MSRCTGHCCREFALDIDKLTVPGVVIEDGDTIREMVILLEPIADGRRTCTCRYFDGRDCLNYEGRPAMCRDYPYGRTCTKIGCTKANGP